ncbi:MAG: 4-hydroxy-tetrahydrodipicolinate reductase [Proteobacteria bacterium]|nr:4-hydroxy-tetrahydrodipicolinate reductase [Pseudomonadota bacterium]
MADFKIGVAGCTGRMGMVLLRQIAGTDGCAISGGSEAAGHPALGRDVGAAAGLGEIGIKITADPADLFAASDAVLDFTVPEATVRHASLATETGAILVAGTTGMGSNDEAALTKAAKRAAIVYSANFSVGVNVLMRLVELAASILDEDFDIEIAEMHHREKLDAPSGTALALGKAAAAGRGVELERVAQRGRDGITDERRRGDIGFGVLRGGSVVGEHTVIFASDNERVELVHKAQDRSLFSAGAVRAALWARGKPPGFYDMQDVLGLKD